jgi:hypothetical protein
MYRGTTPTYIFTLPESVDMTQATDVYVTFAKTDTTIILTKTGDDLEVTEHTVSVYLTQEETLSFPNAKVAVQLNWIYPPEKRACSNIIYIDAKRNLIDEVIE